MCCCHVHVQRSWAAGAFSSPPTCTGGEEQSDEAQISTSPATPELSPKKKKQNRKMTLTLPHRTPGAQMKPCAAHSALDLFKLYFSTDTTRILCRNTNKCAAKKEKTGYGTKVGWPWSWGALQIPCAPYLHSIGVTASCPGLLEKKKHLVCGTFTKVIQRRT